MAYVPFTKLPQQFFDNLGNPLVNGTINAYLAGTSTPTNMFSDNIGTVAGASVTLDSRGEPTTFKLIWLDSSKNYKFILKDSTGATIWTIDNISADDVSDASMVTYTPAGSGAVATTVQTKLRESVSIKDFGAVSNGITDDTAAIQLALDSGAKIVDFLGILSKCDEITVPAGVSAINLNLLKKTAGGNVVRVNSNCRLTGKITGTGTLSIVERGVYPAVNDVTNVTFDLECANLTYGVHGQPMSGTAYADAPKRWSGNLIFTNIAGTTGVSEGYGLLLSPGYECQFDIVSKSPNARHIVYLSAGASNNQIDAVINGCTNYAAQIYSLAPSNACEWNTLNLQCTYLTETVSGQSGPVAIVGLANFNTATFTVNGAGNISYAASIEGSSGGPYPLGNKIVNSSAYGKFNGQDVIRLLNADSTIVTNNSLFCYGTVSVIGMRRTGTNGAINAGFIEGNTINALGQSVKGIYNECNSQPSWIGPNQIQNNGSGLRVDDQSGGYRQGFSRRATFSGTTASISGSSSGDTTATLVTPIKIAGRRTNIVTTGGSGTYFNSAICLVGVFTPGAENQVSFRLYNGAAGAQTLNYEGTVEGD